MHTTIRCVLRRVVGCRDHTSRNCCSQLNV